MDHSPGALALAGALLLANGDDVRFAPSGSDTVVKRSHVTAWSRPLRATRPADVAAVKASANVDGGSFNVLTYNVAGLPDAISPTHPAANIALMSPLLNLYDLAFVQEDFYYHADLISRDRHAFRSEPMSSSVALLADGLAMLSNFALGWIHRVRWTHCNGYLRGASDCLADKGFSFGEIALAPGVNVDIYNLHADAGREELDGRARSANFEQLSTYIQSRSRSHAVIVAGDTNLRMSRPSDAVTFERFLQVTGLKDACRDIQCGDEGIDRVLFRGSADVQLGVSSWRKDPRFVDQRGAALSDHPAIGVELYWRRSPQGQLVMGQ